MEAHTREEVDPVQFRSNFATIALLHFATWMVVIGGVAFLLWGP